MRNHRWKLAGAIAAVLAACGTQPNPQVGGEPATSAGVPQMYAVFAEHHQVIDRLDTPVPLALTAGSSWTLVRSSAPEIVSVESGSLVAHRNGLAELRSGTDPQPLVVVVHAALSLRVEPESLVLSPGAVQPLRVLADGTALPETAVRWSFTDPERAIVEGSRVRAGYKPGKARIIATYGGLEAPVAVEVRVMASSFRVIARNRRLRLGSVEQLIADVPAGAEVVWSSSDDRVLRPLRGGLFQAQAKGSADACANAAGRQTCLALTVQ